MNVMIKLRDFSVRYPGNPNPALNDLSLGVEPGESVLVTGPSGSGKSTLALCITGFIPHAVYADTKGNITVNGVNPQEAGVYELAQFAGLVQQDPEGQFCTMRVRDEIAFGPENLLCTPEEVISRVNWALDAVGASHLKDRPLTHLSGGEKQRIALAAVLAMKPKLLIVDEPTAHLDPRATASLLKLFQDLQSQSDLSLMILEHKPWRFKDIATRVIELKDGTVTKNVPAYDVFPPRRKQPRTSRYGDGGRELLLNVECITQRYDKRTVLHDVSFQVESGEIVGIMGDNGSGKTTLLLSVMGLIRPERGKVWLRNKVISALPVSTRARDIGMTFQNPNHQLFADCVWREVVTGPLVQGVAEDECQVQAERLLESFGLPEFRDRHPLTLSFGQKRRLNLAAVMVSNPSVLLLDEPFIGQDRASADNIILLLEQIASLGKGIVLVGHDPDLIAECCDRLIFMEDGQITVDAQTEEAFRELERRGEYDYLPSWWGA